MASTGPELAVELKPLFDQGVTPVEILECLVREGLDFGSAVNVFAEKRSDLELAYVAAACDQGVDGELEIDDNAIVSMGDDPGAYVMAWVWVNSSEVPADLLEGEGKEEEKIGSSPSGEI